MIYNFARVVILLLFSVSCFSQKEMLSELLSSNDLKLRKAVYSITRDYKGFLWIGGPDGLYRYDGYNIKEYRHQSGDTTSIGSSEIMQIIEKRDSTLWIATIGGGLNMYDRNADCFIRFNSNSSENSIASNNINAIAEDAQGNIWIGFRLGGLDIYHTKEKRFIHFNSSGNNLQKDIYDISEIALDKQGNIWIASWKNGLFFINPQGNNFKIRHFGSGDAGSGLLSDLSVPALYADRSGTVLAGTRDGVIHEFNSEENKFLRTPIRSSIGEISINSICENSNGELLISTTSGLYSYDRGKSSPSLLVTKPMIPSLLIYSYIDKSGIVWVGTNEGLYKIKKDFFSHHLIPSPRSSSNNILSIVEDSKGKIWIGTWGGGVWTYNGNQFIAFQRKIIGSPNISMDILNTFTLHAGKSGHIFIGTHQNGLLEYNPNRDELINVYSQFPDLILTEEQRLIQSILEQNNGNILIGTQGGLLEIDKARQKINTFTHDPSDLSSISDNYITDIYTLNDKNILVSTLLGGLNIIETEVGKKFSFSKIIWEPDNPSSLSSNTITCLFEDRAGNIWIGTNNAGINIIHKNDLLTHKNKPLNFKHLDVKNGLSDNQILSITGDNNNNVWITGQSTISRINIQNLAITNYSEKEGIEISNFGLKTATKLNDGKILLGGRSGLISFSPDSVFSNLPPPNILLTQFKINNEIIEVNKKNRLGRIHLREDISETSNISLNYQENGFSFEFTSMDFSSPEKNRYAYKLEGFDNDWSYTDATKRFSVYTNIPPGNYTFRVIGSNSDGVWNNAGSAVKIKILPPAWKTWWAVTIYFLLLAGIWFVIKKMIVYKSNIENTVKIERIKHEKNIELHQLKLRFFTYLSHEFRTPLTLILGPIEKLKNKTDSDPIIEELKTIERNSNKLLMLVNQLMDLLKLDHVKMDFNPENEDLVKFVSEIVTGFNPLASDRNIDYAMFSELNSYPIMIDKDKIEKILVNLLFNAFKFTNERGKIEVRIFQQPKSDYFFNDKTYNKLLSYPSYIKISVRDSGQGIPEGISDKIFERFYKIDEKQYPNLGTGIGLSLAKEFAEMHKGLIFVDSKLSLGTCFILLLPTSSTITPVSKNEKEFILNKINIEEYTPKDPAFNEQIRQNKEYEKPHIILIEDDLELRKYLFSMLSASYNIIESGNGIEGLDIIKNELPDLVVSDILLPGMDGLEICKNVKTDIKTCHIPVILLTALSTIENRIEGLETGADSYIPKPFSPKHLEVRIRTLIESRKKIINKYLSDFSSDISSISHNSLDEKFLAKIIEIIESHLSDSELTIESFSKEIGMSRVQLFRKLKAIANQSPSEFVRTIRLKHAAKLLINSQLTISEIAYETGFNSPSYFTVSFKKQFGYSPKEFVSNYKDKPSDQIPI